MSALSTLAESLGLIHRGNVSERIIESQSAEDSALIPTRSHISHDPRSLDAVYRALAIIEGAIRQLSLDVWRGSEIITAPSIVERPALDMSRGAFLAETASSLAQRGNAYWRIDRAADGSALNVEVLNPLDVTPYKTKQNRLRFSYQGQTLRPRKDIIHLRLTHTPGEVLGLGPIQACNSRVRSALELNSYADNWTRQGGNPTGILTTDQVLTSEQAKDWKREANKSLTYAEGVAVFGNGLKYQRLLLDPTELQFLENQAANVTSIARMFGIPARLILAQIDGSAMTYANLEQDEIVFLRYTLMAYIRELEDAFDQLTARGQTVRFNLDGLLRTDTKTRYESHQIGIAAGFLTTDEVRAIEGLTPMTTNQQEEATNADN